MKHQPSIRTGKEQVSLELITPEKAKKYLQLGAVDESLKQEHNRPMKARSAGSYASTMMHGEWCSATSMIVFDINGRLIDGQNRLMGVLLSNTCIEFTVLRGAHPESIVCIDTGARRTLSDHLKIRGVKNYHLSAAVIPFIYVETLKRSINWRNYSCPINQTLAFQSQNKQLCETITNCASKNRSFAITGSVTVAFILLARKYPFDDVVEFFEQLAHGHGKSLEAFRLLGTQQKALSSDKRYDTRKFNAILTSVGVSWLTNRQTKNIVNSSVYEVRYNELTMLRTTNIKADLTGLHTVRTEDMSITKKELGKKKRTETEN